MKLVRSVSSKSTSFGDLTKAVRRIGDGGGSRLPSAWFRRPAWVAVTPHEQQRGPIADLLLSHRYPPPNGVSPRLATCRSGLIRGTNDSLKPGQRVQVALEQSGAIGDDSR